MSIKCPLNVHYMSSLNTPFLIPTARSWSAAVNFRWKLRLWGLGHGGLLRKTRAQWPQFFLTKFNDWCLFIFWENLMLFFLGPSEFWKEPQEYAINQYKPGIAIRIGRSQGLFRMNRGSFWPTSAMIFMGNHTKMAKSRCTIFGELRRWPDTAQVHQTSWARP